MASLARVFRTACQTVPRFVRLNSQQMQTLHNLQCKFRWNNLRVFAYSTEVDPADPRTIPNAEWEKKLTAEQYAVCREKQTEQPYSGAYVNHYEKGIYQCVCCGAELFSSDTKFDSGSGWPSFYEPCGKKNSDEAYSNILRRPDTSMGMVRVEVLCKKCDSHLGHVFSDGPEPTGERFCINSLSLKFAHNRK